MTRIRHSRIWGKKFQIIRLSYKLTRLFELNRMVSKLLCLDNFKRSVVFFYMQSIQMFF